MNLYDTLRTALYNSSKVYFPSNELIHSHQGGQEPRGTYCSINILNVDKIGMQDQSTYASGTPELRITNHYEVIVRYMFVGREAGDVAYEFESSIDHPAARFAFGTENLAIMRKSEVNRVPEKRDTTWVNNFTLDVVFSYAVYNTQSIEIIENVSWNENLN